MLSACCPSPAPREREGPNPKGWEGEGVAAPSPGSLSLATLSRGAGEGFGSSLAWPRSFVVGSALGVEPLEQLADLAGRFGAQHADDVIAAIDLVDLAG